MELPRSLRLASWAAVAATGSVSWDEAAEHVVGADVGHRVIGVPGESSACSLPIAIARLAKTGTGVFRLALPAPGDLLGLSGPPSFNERALAAGEAVLCGAPTTLGLVPEIERTTAGSLVTWHVLPASAPDRGLYAGVPRVSEAEAALNSAMRAATSTLVDLDVARWQPDVADAIRSLRSETLDVALPPGYPQRAVRLLSSATRLSVIAALSAQFDGNAVSATSVRMRSEVLTDLARTSRHALVSACHAIYEPDVTSA